VLESEHQFGHKNGVDGVDDPIIAAEVGLNNRRFIYGNTSLNR